MTASELAEYYRRIETELFVLDMTALGTLQLDDEKPLEPVTVLRASWVQN